jgi:hypothetical protein
MVYTIAAYIAFLDGVIAECGPAPCLTPASNAVTRRAKASYFLERESLLQLASRQRVIDFPLQIYDELWTKLCKRKKYGVLRDDYAKPKESAHDLRYPQDGRLIPCYAKDALAQLRTLAECVAEAGSQMADKVKAA